MTARIEIISGGGRGLGRNTVLHLAKRGVHSIFTYHSSGDEARAAAGEQAGAKAVPLKLDTGEVAAFDPARAARRR